MVVLHALGQCLIRTAITTITPRAEMCFALASYLTNERGNRVPRRKLEKLFWPRMHAADASHSLSELIHKLRRKGVHIHRDEASCIWLPRDAASIDIESLSSEPAASLATRDLSVLPGYAPRASDAFNDWVDEWRAQMRFRVLDDVLSAIKAPQESGDWQVVLRLSDQALRIDPENETALVARARAAAALSRQCTASSSASSISSSPRDVAQLRESSLTTPWISRHLIAANGDTTLVGRDATMSTLLAKAARVLEGDVRAAHISGPTGVGKSRVVRELSTWIEARGAAVCAISCGRHDVHRPLSAFVQAVPQLHSLPGAAGCAPSTLACLARVTHATAESTDVAASIDSPHVPASIRTSLMDLIDAISDEQPLLLAIEDVHWVDQASWSLLRAIVATAQRSVLIVCTSRQPWQHSAWGDPDAFVVEELQSLDAAAARQLTTNYLTKVQRSADDRFIDWCVEASGGNPYFIEELVNYWIATGNQYSAPPSLIAVVEARLACLKPEALRVIQGAAILGKNSTIGLLQHVLEFPTHVLFSALEELSHAGLLSITAAPDEPRSAPVICRHDLVMRAATRGLSPQGRALLHHAAARAIEWGASGSYSAELLWDCADHWHAAGESDRSVSAALACAQHLHEMGFADEAVERCRSALSRCHSDPSRLTVLSAIVLYAAPGSKSFREATAQLRELEDLSR